MIDLDPARHGVVTVAQQQAGGIPLTRLVPASYTGYTRVRPVDAAPQRKLRTDGIWLVASRLTTTAKESDVGDNQDSAQDDMYAARRAELDRQYQALPPTSTAEYWSAIEGVDGREPLPLEVLARCLRERTAEAPQDAERIFTAILLRVQSSVGHWARIVAHSARSGMKPQLQEDLEQECLMKLWEELRKPGQTFLLENFASVLHRIEQHVAHVVMERLGEWKRPGVERPARVPTDQTESMQNEAGSEGETPLTKQFSDPDAQSAFDLAEVSDLLDLVAKLPPEQRTVIYDRFWHDLPQSETAKKLGISDRMVRYRLTTILRELRESYAGGEENNHV